MTTTIVSFHDVKEHWNSRAGTWDSPKWVYIGRAYKSAYLPASKWANPFSITRERGESEASARLRSINSFRAHVERHSELVAAVEELRGKTLVCFCKDAAHPDRPCHGDVLLELLGEKPVNENSRLAAQIALDGKVSHPPVLAWDKGGAAYEIEQDRHGRLYRSETKNKQLPLGIPGKVYIDWMDWRRDWLKLTLRVTGSAIFSGMTDAEYARFRYCTYLKSIEGRSESRFELEREILRELLADLETEEPSTKELIHVFK